MYYTIYKITNVVNNKIYIGAHKTNNLDDDYMGSGKILKRAINKYGIENFKKEILEVFDNPEDMFEMESVLVNEDFVKNSKTYNIKIGGEGGFDYINESGKNIYGKNGQSGYGLENLITKDEFIQLLKNDEWSKSFSSKVTKGLNKYYKNGGKNGFFGKTHSQKTKEKISKSASIHQSGEGNSQYGTMWITDGKETRKIKKVDKIPDGWYKGRIIKKEKF